MSDAKKAPNHACKATALEVGSVEHDLVALVEKLADMGEIAAARNVQSALDHLRRLREARYSATGDDAPADCGPSSARQPRL